MGITRSEKRQRTRSKLSEDGTTIIFERRTSRGKWIEFKRIKIK